MELYGRRYEFALTVSAACDIAELCPDGELKNFSSLITGGGVKSASEGREKLICALSRGYEERRRFEEPGYKPEPLTPELLGTLDLITFRDLFEEAFAAFLDGLKTSVATEPAKKNEADGGSAAVH